MSLWSALVNKLKEIVSKMVGSKTIEQTLRVTPVISTEMENAITLWGKMYCGKAPWVHEPTDEDPTRVVSLGLPAMISSEKARMALLEWESEITTPTEEVEVENENYEEPQPNEFGAVLPTAQTPTVVEEQPIGDTSRAEFLNKQYQEKLKPRLRNQLEVGLAKGGFVIKPYPIIHDKDNGGESEIEFDFIQADGFYPIAFNASGKITEAAFLQTKVDKDYTYRRLEYHKWENGKVTIVNKAFQKANADALYGAPRQEMTDITLGKEIPLTDVPEWSSLEPETTIKDVQQPLFAYFKMPEANTVDMTSPLGASCFARAKSLIHDADEQYSRLLWEYEGGELAIDIDRDAIRPTVDAHGNITNELGAHQQRLFRKVDLSQTGDTYYPYTPSLRDSNYSAGLNTILMRIEDVCAISRGTLSDGAAEARTATELKILKQRSYSANAEIQEALQTMLEDVVYIMDVYCDLYQITTKGEYDVSFEWDDSLLVDKETELNTRLTLMQQGIASKLETRMWYFGETERQAQEALAKIEEDALKNAADELQMQAAQMQMQNTMTGGEEIEE